MTGTLAFVGGGEFRPGTQSFDAELLTVSGGTDVVVVPTAAAYERPEHKIEDATRHFAELGATVTPLMAMSRRETRREHLDVVREASFIYLTDGSPLHLRSVIKDSPFYEAIVHAYSKGAVLAASGAGATVLGDPMVDPRGGAYTVGLGLVNGLAIFPYHGSTAAHLWDRSKDLLPKFATLVGVDEQTALIRDHEGAWRVAGAGRITVHRKGEDDRVVAPPSVVLGL